MADPHLPRTAPVSVSAKLAGFSFRSFVKRFLDTGLIACERSPGGRPSVVLASLEQATGKTVTVADYLAANRALDARRQYQAEYRTRVEATRQSQEGSHAPLAYLEETEISDGRHAAR